MYLIFLSHFYAQANEQTQSNPHPCTDKKLPTAIDTQPTQPLSLKPLIHEKIERIKEYREGCTKLVVQVVYQAYCYRFHTCVWNVFNLCIHPIMRSFSIVEGIYNYGVDN